MFLWRRAVSVLAASVLATPALGQITVFNVTSYSPGDVLPGYVTYDMTIDFVGQVTGLQLLTEFEHGTIYQDPIGSNTAPLAAFFPFFPTMEFDTFATLGGFTVETADAAPGFAGAAINIYFELGRTQPDPPNWGIDDERIDLAWFPAGAVGIFDETDYPIFRLTVSDDTTGVFHLLGAAGGAITDVVTVTVPEPASAAIALAGVLCFRRRLTRARAC